MTLQQLRYFIVIAESGSFGKAAQKLYISQPSVSSVVKELEKELEIEIFVRTPKGVHLTEQGRELYRYALELIDKSDEILGHFRNEKRSRRELLTVSSQHYSFLIEAMSKLAGSIDAEKYTLRIKETNMMNIIEDVAKLRSDIGVIYKAGYSEKYINRLLGQNSIEFIEIKKTKPHVFLSKSHPLAGREFLRYRDLKPYMAVNYNLEENIPMFFAEEINDDAHFSNKNIYTNDLYTSVSFIKNNMAYDIGTGLLSDDLKEDIAVIPLDSEEVMTIGVIRNRNVPMSSVVKKLIKLIEQEFE